MKPTLEQSALLDGPEVRFWDALERESFSPARVLCADDEAEMRQIARFCLNAAGFVVTTAEDGEEAWELLRSENFDVLVTDLKMPRLTGLELMERLRLADLRLPVIVMSGSLPDLEHQMELQSFEPAAVLAKPFEPSELVNTVREVLQKASSRPRPFIRSSEDKRSSGFRRGTIRSDE